MSKFCGNCGCPVDDTKKYCPKCGRLLNVTVMKKDRKDNFFFNKITAIFAIVILLAGGFYLYNNYSGNVNLSLSQVIAVKEPVKNITEYVEMKDKYNMDISVKAQNINDYIAKHGDLKGAIDILDSITKLKNQISTTRTEYVNTYTMKKIIGNAYYKTLLDLYDLELTRIEALEDGVNTSINGGNAYANKFKRGTDASYKYDSVNEKFMRMQH